MLPVVLFFALAVGQPAPPAPNVNEQNQECLTCHSDASMEVDLPSGEKRSLQVVEAVLAKSVHGGKLACVDCHNEAKELPHPSRDFQNKRQFTLAYSETCKRCHFKNFSRTLDGVHAIAVKRGDNTAPICVDCHGSHDIASPTQPRTRISETCAKCHAGVMAAYSKSVHGKALGTEGNPDVPTCTDCHRSHDVAGPTNAAWESHTPDLCARCHANEPLMKKYGLSTFVHRSYVSDFHGTTVALRAAGPNNGEAVPVVARCTDCHGVHDITKVDDPKSPVLRANLVQTCRRCHKDASENFPAAWLSHYEPSPARAPLVYSVTLAYRVLIPFIVGGLALQILLHLWRVVVNR